MPIARDFGRIEGTIVEQGGPDVNKLLILAAGAAGYVLGTKAGRERYDQIRQQTQKVWNNPTVQDGVGHATDAAKTAAASAGTKVAEGASAAASAATGKVAEMRNDDDTPSRASTLDASAGDDLDQPQEQGSGPMSGTDEPPRIR